MSETAKKKLIEVALPLEEINAACKADKDRKTGTIRNLHKWFAPAPLPAWRALLFAALVDDPAEETERAELLDLIKRLVANGADLPDHSTLEEARSLIRKQFPDGLPTVMDSFCGGGSTLIEAQRLGLPTYGSDLNPVPVLITRTLTELLPKIHGRQPLNPEPEGAKSARRTEVAGQSNFGVEVTRRVYTGYDGLVRDVTHYAERVREKSWDSLKQHYPCEPGETSIAWLWARTAQCPNPACGMETLLTTSWWLSKRKGDLAWIEPKVEDGRVELDVVSGRSDGAPPSTPKIGDGVFACLACAATLDGRYLRSLGMEHRLGWRMTAICALSDRNRIYRTPKDADRDAAAEVSEPDDTSLPLDPGGQGVRVGAYGVASWQQLFLNRQYLALETLAANIRDCYDEVIADGGTELWAESIVTLLTLGLGKVALFGSVQNRWSIDPRSGTGKVVGIYGMPTIPMSWDFGEANPFSAGAGSWTQAISLAVRAVNFVVPDGVGIVEQRDAIQSRLSAPGLVATDPPYFEAIGYADLSDFFYMWHRKALQHLRPADFQFTAAPKSGELIASRSRHGNSEQVAKQFFISGFTDAFANLQLSMADGLPMLVIYASKEQKTGQGEESRWESILTAMVDAGLQITGTWPIHMTSSARLREIGSNAVAAYVVMVCRPRSPTASTVSLNEFSRELRRELPAAIHDLQAGSILPVDLYQAALGPGMQIYSRYRKVEDSHGERVPVGRALELITAAVGSVLDEQEGELDSASRFAVTWWEQHGWQSGPFGEADKVARGYGTYVDDVVRAEVITALPGKGVQLLGVEALDRSWTPAQDSKPTAWEAVHHLADRLINGGGETEAAALLAQLGDLQGSSRTLAYRLHDIAAKNGWAKDQERYNALIGRWSSMLALAATHNPEGLF